MYNPLTKIRRYFRTASRAPDPSLIPEPALAPPARADKIKDYFILLTPRGDALHPQQQGPYDFKQKLSNWIASQTGCEPAIDVVKESVGTDSPKLTIQCTEAWIDRIKAHYGTAEIADTIHLCKLSEIPLGERTCWTPRNP
jgi:hypothetical protein